MDPDSIKEVSEAETEILASACCGTDCDQRQGYCQEKPNLARLDH
jgi:hypothetical protein